MAIPIAFNCRLQLKRLHPLEIGTCFSDFSVEPTLPSTHFENYHEALPLIVSLKS